MPTKSYKPVTKSRRKMSVLDYSVLTADKPAKKLTVGKKCSGGRNNAGRMTVRFRGSGNKRRYRLVDFMRTRNEAATIKTLEYDPNRSCFINLVEYADGTQAYFPAIEGVEVGAVVLTDDKCEVKDGNCMKLRNIPVGMEICCIELEPGRGAKMVRGAGQYAILRAKEGEYAQVKLPSGEVRLVHLDSKAIVGRIGNGDHMNVKLGKAGKKRYLGFRPHVRGVVQNPIDHPMGGGEGRSSGGGHPVSPWGKLAKGKKTRCPRKNSKRFIVERRKK